MKHLNVDSKAVKDEYISDRSSLENPQCPAKVLILEKVYVVSTKHSGSHPLIEKLLG